MNRAMVSLLHLLITVPFILIPFFLQFVSPDTTVTYISHLCDDEFSSAPNSVFQNNLNHLLTNLSAEAPLTNFYNATSGQGGDKAYALFFGPAFTSSQICKTCIQTASQDITQQCPVQKGAIMYYVECFIRYANYSFFSPDDQGPSTYSSSQITFYNTSQFVQVLKQKMDGLIKQATFGSPAPEFATGEGNFTGSQQIYCFVQCTPGVNASSCNRCLRSSLTDLLSYGYGVTWALLYGPNCQMRYSLTPFYSVAPSPALPPSGATANRTNTTTSPFQPSSGKINTSVITAIISAAVFAILIIFLGTCLIRRKVRTSRKTKDTESLQFDYGTIRDATANFSDANKLGEGGFGPVYKGVLSNGQEIAVKKLSGNSKQGQEEFKNEVVLLARLRHRNLVSLLGFCFEGIEKVLIYEFMPNKSLDHFIFDPVNRAHLDWEGHNKIIQGIARGLLYLHEDSQDRIIHRDLKTGNILLDAEMEPKISDFGTARQMIFDQSHYTASRIMGTIGYMPPEYFKRGHFSVKLDVFSFGVILLEILSGQKIFRFRDENNDENLLSYAWKCWSKNTALDIVDSTLITDPKNEALRFLHIGLLCVQENAADRPTMALVVNMLTSSSFTLSQPSRPAFFMAEKVDRVNFIHDSSSTAPESSDPSENKSEQWSINGASITELEGR